MKIHKIGDVHLGKKFEAGVPLHRRGDRERMQQAQFLAELAVECDMNIQVGDLFDKMFVPYTVIWFAAQAYIAAKKANPERVYALLRGNHDASRDLERVSAFQIFTGLVRPHGIIVADEQGINLHGVALIPWHPVHTAAEMVEKYVGPSTKTVYGHWDVVMGQDNQIPAARLKELGVEQAVTGHDHNQRDMVIDGLDVHVTGSMQPYSHSEDEAELIYVTRTLADVLADPDAFKNQCLRVVLEPNQVLDLPIDCLQLQLQRGKDMTEQDMGEVDFEEFDLNVLFGQACAEVGLTDDMIAATQAKLDEERAARS